MVWQYWRPLRFKQLNHWKLVLRLWGNDCHCTATKGHFGYQSRAWGLEKGSSHQCKTNGQTQLRKVPERNRCLQIRPWKGLNLKPWSRWKLWFFSQSIAEFHLVGFWGFKSRNPYQKMGLQGQVENHLSSIFASFVRQEFWDASFPAISGTTLRPCGTFCQP